MRKQFLIVVAMNDALPTRRASKCKPKPTTGSPANLQEGKWDDGRKSDKVERPGLRAVLQQVRNRSEKLAVDLVIA